MTTPTQPPTRHEQVEAVPDVPAGKMRPFWCITKGVGALKEHGRMLCYGNAFVMPLSDQCCDPPKDAVPVGDEGDFAWTGWWEESCDQCDTYWIYHGDVLAWMELPQTLEAVNSHARQQAEIAGLRGALRQCSKERRDLINGIVHAEALVGAFRDKFFDEDPAEGCSGSEQYERLQEMRTHLAGTCIGNDGEYLARDKFESILNPGGR